MFGWSVGLSLSVSPFGYSSPAPSQSSRVLDAHKRSPLGRLWSAPLGSPSSKTERGDLLIFIGELVMFPSRAVTSCQKVLISVIGLALREMNAVMLATPGLNVYVKLNSPLYMMDPDQVAPNGGSEKGEVTNAICFTYIFPFCMAGHMLISPGDILLL